MLSLPPLPPEIGTLTTEESVRLERHYPDLPPTPQQCITCRGTKKFTWYPRIEGVELSGHAAARDRLVPEEYECPCPSQWIMHRYFLNAGIGLSYQRRSWADVVCEPGAIDKIVEYLADRERYVANGFGLFLYGGTGTGKTLLSILVLKRLLAEGHNGYFTTFNEMLDTFAGGWHSEDERRWFHQRIKNAGVLVVDDPGREMKGRVTLPEAVLDEVMRHRVGALRPTIITTNDSLDQFRSRYGEYVFSLLTERASTHRFEGTDYRPTSRQRLLDEIKAGLTRPIVVG